MKRFIYITSPFFRCSIFTTLSPGFFTKNKGIVLFSKEIQFCSNPMLKPEQEQHTSPTLTAT